ncbi:MAG TPA: hypothetical protein VGO40_06050 [Longimicrobium sp.]|jgi:hypothetical protein|nr:hypothetical protein [Longimicrobium sp.]
MGETDLHQSEEEEERAFWLAVSRPSMDAIWANDEDDVYAELLKTDRPADLDTKD